MKTKGTGLCLGLFALFFCLAWNNASAQLKANFSSNVQSGCAPLIVAFEDNSTGNPTSWTWTLGNGTVASNQNPVTTYFDPGTYTIKLSIKGASGKDSLIKTSYITVYANPQVAFDASPTAGCFPLDVKFTNNSKAGSGTITEYLWDYGDGYVDTLAKGAHTYLSGGTFNVTLKITNSYGCSNASTSIGLIKIDDGVNASFNLSSLNICKTPATAVFENTSEGSGAITYKWDFGDGGTSTATSPSHSFANSGSYNVLLTAATAAGCSDTAKLTVDVHLPVSSFKYSNGLCLNQAIQFTNTSNPAPVSCKWYFGDGTTSADLNPEKAYNKTGTYTVKLVNFFASGCADSTTGTITIGLAPTTSFFADDTLSCTAPLNVNFTNKTDGAVTNYLWDFGDGDTSSVISPMHTYTKEGNYSITLTAFTENGCSSTFTKNKYVVIQPVKITGLNNLPDSGCVPLVVKPSINLNQDYGIKKYTWDFGDGSASSTDESPSHIYTKEGFFNVKVTIETEHGCTATYTLPNAVLAGHKPTASFITLRDSVCASDSGEFINTSTNGPITFVSWDGNLLTDSVEGHFYAKKAMYEGYRPVMLVVYNYGCPDTLRKDSAIYINPPIARINLSTLCNDKQRIQFTDSSIEDKSRTWYFGDGQTDVTKNPEHVYASPGNYSVTLITNNNTCSDTTTADVHVINEKGTISLPNKTYCRGNNFTADISNINLGNIKRTTWDFGDGTVITVNGATKATHAYIAAGKFKIKATMVDKNNCQYSYESPDSITVFGPLASFISNTQGSCEGQNIVFTDRSNSDGAHSIINWSWDFGDGNTYDYNTSAATINHTYIDTGYNTVRLTVTDNYGCSDSARKSKYIYITQPSASFIISDSIACPGKQISFQNTSAGSELSYTWDFGDGTQNNSTNPSHNYKSGVYNPQLYVTDVNGCKDTFSIPNILVSKPVADFSLSDSVSTCPPLEVNFANNSTNFTSSSWSFGDGSPSVVTSPTHIYTYPGVFPVKLITKGYGGCADTSIIKNIIIKGPTGSLSYNADPVCYPATTKFTAIANNTVTYTWDFSDGNTISTTTNKTNYSYQPGNYVPKLILQDAAGCKVSIKGADTLKIYDVKANATIVGGISCKLNPVEFTDASVSADVVTHRYWFFGDGDSTDQKSVTHVYDSEGNYNAYLVAVTKLGCRDTFNLSAPVQVLPKPDISITGDAVACAMASTGFAGVSSTKDSSIIWNWDFGNGEKYVGQHASTTYNNKGNYTINLIGINSGGCADTASATIAINAMPTVKAGNDTAICQGGVYQLKATGAETYNWVGNNLNCSNCSAPTVNPYTTSTYIVTGKDAIGCSNTDSVTINIIAPSKITVSNADTLCVGESTTLTASGATTYQWYPSAYLNNDKSASPVFTASSDTSITYKVIGHTANNCFADTGYVSIKTYPIPKLDISHNEIVLNVGASVQLHTNSSPDITSWRWSPPQGLSSSVVANPVASPAQSTTYSVIASNGGSCVARDEITINVICNGGNVFIPNTFSPNNDGMNDVFYPRGTGLFKIKSFRVFNRWGQIVFDKSNASPNNASDGWNGSLNGKPLNADVYIYIIEVLCDNNMVIPFKGNITLIR